MPFKVTLPKTGDVYDLADKILEKGIGTGTGVLATHLVLFKVGVVYDLLLVGDTFLAQ